MRYIIIFVCLFIFGCDENKTEISNWAIGEVKIISGRAISNFQDLNYPEGLNMYNTFVISSKWCSDTWSKDLSVNLYPERISIGYNNCTLPDNQCPTFKLILSKIE